LFIADRMPAALTVPLGELTLKALIRMIGGMDLPADILYPFFDIALEGMSGGGLWSGATRCLGADGSISPSVAEVVARIGQRDSSIFTAGSAPRTDQLRYQGESQLYLTKGVIMNPSTQFVVLIQKGAEPEDVLKWDGDVRKYLEFMLNLKKLMGFNVGGIVYGGGGVTVTEATMAHEMGMPVFVVRGSGRQADEKLAAAVFNGKGIHHVGLDEPWHLRRLLMDYGLSN
jgi:hypothetical protein